MNEAPGKSFPNALTPAELLGTYRFLNNEKVTAEKILTPHFGGTLARALGVEKVLIAHDTTELNFGVGEREGLGRVGRGKSQGLYAHFALALNGDGSRYPLGVAGLRTHTREGEKKKKRRGTEQREEESNESHRWRLLVEEIEGRLDGRVRPIHLMDREADDFSLMASLSEKKRRFIVRSSHDRKLSGDAESVSEALANAPVFAEREVELGPRAASSLPTNRRLHPPRKQRVAKLSIHARQVLVKQPRHSISGEAVLALNLVHVIELDPPDGEQQIEWKLWTNEPIETEIQVLAIVDAYRARWVIEEFFKALKSGCQIEKRQLESKHALLNALAIFAPIAWRLLSLRNLGRAHGQLPATQLFNKTQLICLRALLARKRNFNLAANPTIREAMIGVAKLAGHLDHNGDPGWKLLGEGFETLLLAEEFYALAKNL